MATLWGIDLVARRPNFVSWVLGELLEGREVQLFTDQTTTPSYANQVAEVLVEMVRNDCKGVYNVVSQGCQSKYDMGLKVAEFFGKFGVVAGVEGVQDFVGFFDQVGAEGGVGLFAVPGAAAGGAEAGHDGGKFGESGAGVLWARGFFRAGWFGF